MTVSKLITKITDDFKKSGIMTPELDAGVIISHILKTDRHRLIIDNDKVINESEKVAILKLAHRRLNGEPIAYLTGYKEFYSLNFLVNKDVLIPRPETELLVDLAIFYAEKDSKLLDLCTGSGAIGVSIKYNRQDIRVSASDISDKALNIAKKNALNISGKNTIHFFSGDLFAPLKGLTFNIIVTNPPYIDPLDKCSLQKELSFEPDIALYSENMGENTAKKIISESKYYLADNGIIIMEIGYNMRKFIISAAKKEGYRVSIINDYSGLPRIAIMRLKA